MGFSTQHSWNYNITKIFSKCSWRGFSSGRNFYILIKPYLFNTSFSVTCPHRVFCSNNAVSKSILLSSVKFLYEKLKKYSMQSFKECLLFVFCLFLFCFVLLLYNNTLHVMCYTYICYWNTCKYIV